MREARFRHADSVLDTGELPREWQQLAARRLSHAAAIATGIALVSWPLTLLMQPNIGVRAGTERPVWLLPIGLVMSVAMIVIARSDRLTPQRRVDIGIGYFVLLCLATGLFRHALPYADADVVRGVSPITAGILFFAVFIPVHPRRMAIAAIAGAAADPTALWIVVQTGLPSPAPNLWLWLFMPNVVIVVLAVVVSRLLFRIVRTLEQAREMGSYRLTELLGRGGMGEVWRAEHRSLARPAAVKLVSPSHLGGDDTAGVDRALTRFEREAQTTALLSSPHTIEVYDFGVAEDGTFYYVMELLEGMDMATMVKRHGALPPARVAHMLGGIAHSLRDAHDAGLIHRDIKPANIYVCRKGGEHDFVKVLDFGLVKRFTSEEDAQLTAVGAIAGTPAYMAPEAVRGDEVDPRSDLYSVGCVAYFLLTGRDVFMASGIAPLLIAQVERKPEPVADAAEQPIDPGLCDIVMRCLEKDPAARLQSAQALMDAIDATELATGWSEEDADGWWSEREAAVHDVAEAPTETAVELPAGDARGHLP